MAAQPLTAVGRAHQAKVARFRMKIPRRDSQRSKVYAGERRARARLGEAGCIDMDQMRAQLDAMIAGHGVHSLLKFKKMRGANAGIRPLAEGGIVHLINVGDHWAGLNGSLLVMPHEYAHVLCAAATHGPSPVFSREPWHHPVWCAVYLALLARHCSPEVAEMVRCGFEAERVIYAESPAIVRRVLKLEN